VTTKIGMPSSLRPGPEAGYWTNVSPIPSYRAASARMVSLASKRSASRFGGTLAFPARTATAGRTTSVIPDYETL
jgi:hypothetical protein